MKKLSYLLAAAALILLPSCRFIKVNDQIFSDDEIGINEESSEHITPSDNLISKDQVTGEFHSLQCNIPGDVIYTPGSCALSLNGPDNVLQHITVKNENGTLVIKTDGTTFRNFKKFTVTLSSPVLEDLTFNGAVDFSAPQGITALDFKAIVNGAGDIDINGLQADKASLTVNGAGDATLHGLDCESLTVAINGAGDAVLTGRSGSADLSISGAGDIDAKQLDCADISSKVRGIGSIRRPD